jgi:hypothetical protein
MHCRFRRFIMRTTRHSLANVLILAGCMTAGAGHAQITKCIDQAGQVTYSDGSCGDAVQVQYIDVTAPESAEGVGNPALTVKPAVSASPMALDNVPVRESAWATMPMAARHASTDAQTIRAAREALAENDRGLAALRTQKLALNR